MRYFVLDPQGAPFGPADLPLLNQWAAQGRIAPGTILVEEGTGRQIPAISLPGLHLPGGPNPGPGAWTPPGFGPAPTSGGGPFYGGAGQIGMGEREAKSSMAMSGISLLLLCCLPFVGIIPSLLAIVAANRARALGASNGDMAFLLAIFSLLAQILISWVTLSVFRGLF